MESIQSSHAVTLTVATSTITNNGTIDVNFGNSGARTISAHIDNRGSFNIKQPLTLSKVGGIFTQTSGTTTVSAGKTLTARNGSQVFNLDGGVFDVDGSVDFRSLTFNANGARIYGTLALRLCVLNLATSSTLSEVTFVMRGSSTISGNVVRGQTVWIQGSNAVGTATLTSAGDLTNDGVIRLESIDGGHRSDLVLTSGVLTNTWDVEVNVGAGGPRSISADIVNHGLFKVNHDLALSKAGGSFSNTLTTTIAAGKILTATAGSQVFNLNAGALEVNGTLNATDAAFNLNGGALDVNVFSMLRGSFRSQGTEVSGTFNLNGSNLVFASTSRATSTTFIMTGSPTLSGDIVKGQTLWVRGSGAGGHTTLTSADGFTNDGLIRLQSIEGGYSSDLTLTNGALTNRGTIEVGIGNSGPRRISADIANFGLFEINHDLSLTKGGGIFTNTLTTTIAAGRTLTATAGSQVFNLNAGALEVNGTLNATDAAFNLNGGALDANAFTMLRGSFRSQGTEVSGTFNLNGSNLVFASTSRATSTTFIMTGSPTLSGDIMKGQTLWVRGSGAADGFTNDGLIRLQSIEGGYSSDLTLTNGALTNRGTIEVGIGNSGPRRISADLVNFGLLEVKHDLSLTKGGGIFTNTLTTTVAAGKTLNATAGSQVFNLNGGGLDVNVFSMLRGSFRSQGAEVSGTFTLNGSNLVFASTSRATSTTFIMTGSPTLSGDIVKGQTLWVRGSGAGGHTTLTSADGFTNDGLIRLQSIEGGYSSDLTLTNGALTNRGTIKVGVGNGGPRRIFADIVNDGLLEINHDLSLTKGGGIFTNTLTTTIAAGRTLTATAGSQVFNLTSGALEVNGTLNATDASFNLNGGAFDANAFTMLRGSFRSQGAEVSGTFNLNGSNLVFASTSRATSTTFIMTGSPTLSGDIVKGQTLWVRGSGAGGHTTLTSAGGFTNDGLIRLQSIEGGYSSDLTLTNGALTNRGTITVGIGNSGPRRISADLARIHRRTPMDGVRKAEGG